MLAGLLFEMETSYFTVTWDQWVAFHTSHASGSSIRPRVKSSHVSVGMIPGWGSTPSTQSPGVLNSPASQKVWLGATLSTRLTASRASESCHGPNFMPCVYSQFTVWHTVGSLPSSTPVFSSLPPVALQDSGCTAGYVDWENTKQLPPTSSIIRQQRALVFALGVKIYKGDLQVCRNS